MPHSKKETEASPILSVRLNDEENPRRAERFEENLAKGGATATSVVRALVDAYIAYVEKNQRLPLFPLEITSGFKSQK